MCSVMAGLTALSGYMQYQDTKAQAAQQAAVYKAQAANYQYQAEAQQRNAQIESRKQEQIADQYAQEQRKLRARQRLTEGSLRAQTGASGLNFAGSSMDILSSSLDAFREDSMNLLTNQRNDNYNSRVQQTNYETAAQNYINQANAANKAASNVMKNAKKTLVPTILGTAVQIYGMESGSSRTSSFGTSGGTAQTPTYTAPTVFDTSFYAGQNVGLSSSSLFNTSTSKKNKYSLGISY